MTTNDNKLKYIEPAQEKKVKSMREEIDNVKNANIDTLNKDKSSKRILVKNAKGTGEDNINKPWIEHWEEKTGRKRDTCSKIGCDSSESIEGAHVQKVGDNTDTMYIVPLCHKCNTQKDSEEFYVDEELVKVSED